MVDAYCLVYLYITFIDNGLNILKVIRFAVD